MVNTQLQGLLNKEVSRKEFLGISALAIGSVFGFGTFIKLFTGKSLGNHKALVGYGGSNYGNKTNSTVNKQLG